MPIERFLKIILLGFSLSGASVLHARTTTPQSFWYRHDFHLDGGTILGLNKNNSGEKEAIGISFTWLPILLVDIGWKWTGALREGFCYQLNLDFSSLNAFALYWSMVIPNTRLSLGYFNSKNMLFTLGLGTKEFARVYGSLAMEMPFSKHFFLTVEAAHPFKRDSFELIRITAKLGYNFWTL